MRKLALLAATVVAATAISATPAQAALVQIDGGGDNGQFSGNDCNSGAPPHTFSDCYATQTGTNDDGDLASLVVAKFTPTGEDAGFEISDNYPSITGDEFDIAFDTVTHILSFTYTPDADDPTLHYFDIKQANGFILFYDAAGILTANIDLDDYFGRQAGGFSHITFFDEQSPGVPEPATWAMMIAGFGAAGMAMRRSRRRKALLAQIA